MNQEGHTPVIKQFLNIKKTHPDDLVFFRMGDFYELFYNDAIEASKILGITLTHRGKSANKPVVMAGVPVSAHKNYLKKLIEAGKSVAICDQITDADNSKGLVQRKVVRIVTAGTIYDSDLVSEKRQTWLLSLNINHGISLIDVSTGELFWFAPLNNEENKQNPIEQIITAVTKFDIGEVLLPDIKKNNNRSRKNLEGKSIFFSLEEIIPEEKITLLPEWEFDAKNGQEILQNRLGISSLEALELTDQNSVLESISALIKYAEKNIGQPIKHLRFPKKIKHSEIVTIDHITQKSLELKDSLYENAKKNITLISCIDKCQTSAGSRLLNFWLLSPIKDNQILLNRQDSIGWVAKDPRIHSVLRGIIDISRIAGRISLSNISPRELHSLSINLYKLVDVNELIKNSLDKNIEGIYKVLSDPQLNNIIQRISNCLSKNCTSKIKDGGFIKSGFDKTLDEFRAIQKNGDDYLSQLEINEKEKTGITNLKIGFSPIQGFFFDVTASQKSKVPENYIRRQTLKNSERFITSELKELEQKILDAKEKSIEREKTIFLDLLRDLQKKINFLFKVSESISLLDVLATLGLKISENNWIIPELSDTPEITITQGSHPVLAVNKNSFNFESNYYPNDTQLNSKKNMMLLTGPNMSGKSTYMKQVALITILARIGSPVPANHARIGIVDRIFTRIGAADDLAGGRSTFMVEMTEAARILHESTNQSLVLLDEIGRGTSTSDGLALALAIATELSQTNKALCLFATHYFELTELENTFDGVKNFHISTEENEERIIFLYELKKGPASKSFGLKVAKLAGIPQSVIQHANKITIPSRTGITKIKKEDEDGQNLFSGLSEKIIEEIKNIEPNDCSPNTALDLLFKWKKILTNKNLQ